MDPHDLKFMKALKARRAGDTEQAAELLEAIVAEAPDHADSLEVLGMLLSERGELDRAIELTERLRQLRPDSIMAHANLSRYWMLKGDKEVAEEWQAKARVLGWKDEMQRQGKNPDEVTRAEQGVDAETLARQEAAVEQDPDSVMARLALASSQRKLGMPVKAVEHLRAALERDPKMSVLYVELGGALEDANLPAEALDVYERGIPIAEQKGDLMPRNKMQVRAKELRKVVESK